MRILTPESDPLTTQSVITIGTFDGLHRGHQNLIQQVVDTAHQHNLPSIVVTFEQHPHSVLFPQKYMGEIIYLQHKMYLLEQLGVDMCLLLPNTPHIFTLPPKTFYTDIILPLLNPHTVIVGTSHSFGNNRDGSPNTLQEFSTNMNFNLIIADLYQDTEIINSTTVRKTLATKDIPHTEDLLGHPLYLSGTVIKGNQFGRTMGYPTANIHPSPHTYHWPSGVYAVYCYIAEKRYKGSLSIGTNSTVEHSSHLHHEVYIHTFEGDLYGEPLVLEIKHFIRDQETYSTIQELKSAIAKDIQTTETLLDL